MSISDDTIAHFWGYPEPRRERFEYTNRDVVTIRVAGKTKPVGRYAHIVGDDIPRFTSELRGPRGAFEVVEGHPDRVRVMLPDLVSIRVLERI